MASKDRDRPTPEKDERVLYVDVKLAAVGGVLAAIVALAGTVAVGQVGGAEARVILEAVLPSIRFLSSGVMAAAATIMALMLTLLSLSYNTNSTLKPGHYARVQQIAFIDSIVLIAAVLLLLFISIPLEQSGEVSENWYTTIYYVLLVLSAALGGALISVVLMLYGAIRDLIRVVEPDDSNPMIVADENRSTEPQR